MRSNDWVVTFRHQDQLTVTYGESRIEFSIGSIYPLNRVAFWTIDLVIIDFLQIDFCGRIVDVMFMGWITRPVAAGCVHLNDHQPLCLKLRLKNVVDLARGISASADLDFDFIWRNQTRRIAAFGARKA